MIRHSTIRLPVAVIITVGAAIVAVMAGRADAAILAAPWTVLLVLGLSNATRQRVSGSVTAQTDRVLDGDELTVTAHIVGARGWVETRIVPDAGFSFEEVADHNPVAQVAAEARPTEFTSTLTASAWGTHDVGRVEIRVNEPYGLLRWRGSLHGPKPIRVHPRPIDLQRLLTPWLVRRLTGAHRSRAVGRGVEYADIREFGAGDTLRDINWRASARSNDLLVSQRHPDRSTNLVLLLDTFTESGHDVQSAIGLAIEAAVGLAESHLSLSDRVGLIELGGIVRWVNPGTGDIQLHRLTDALLATRLYDNASDRRIEMIPPRGLPPRSFIVALTPLLDDRFVDSLAVLKAAGHDVAVVEVPVMFDAAGDQGNSGDSARLAFRLWQAERALTRDLLAERGIAVSLWGHGDHFDTALAELTRRRRRTPVISR